jgi:superfamily I DNA/RNA helicase
LEAERRLFYVAFTRARRKVIMLTAEDGPISRFVTEMGLGR